MKRVLTTAARAGSLAASLLAAWYFFHGLTGAVQAVTSEFRDSALWQQLGVGGDDE